MKTGILLVANLNSQEMCENLIYSIRKAGCKLPIKIIHFGGERINSKYILAEAMYLEFESFPAEGKALIKNLRSVLTQCPVGFLYRFLGWFMDWDAFIYSDNDIVALNNWDIFFKLMEESNADIVHADTEYSTEGKYNYFKPDFVKHSFGEDALLSAITAGHFAIRKSEKAIKHLEQALQWFQNNPDVPIMHDQALLHIASLIGKWNILNLCKPPYSWLSSWSGDYKNALEIIHYIQSGKVISHLHYSGSTPHGDKSIEDFLFSYSANESRLNNLAKVWLQKRSGFLKMQHFKKRLFLKMKAWK